ncbi:MAG: hypothetical protein HYR74_04030 [Candidatus Eisenbacteria bacterium]|nr:hypothetical protein [Candidatus Eisenbacteria bacterium]
MRRLLVPALGLLLAGVFVIAISCSKSTSPAGGGGGGALELNSGTLVNGASYSHVFANAAVYGYHCQIHGTGMAGSVTVAGGGADSMLVSVGPGGTLSYSPNAVTIKPGGTVRWINVSGGTNHTVTSN